MKKILSKLANKVATTYGVMTSNASIALFFSQSPVPKCLVKKD